MGGSLRLGTFAGIGVYIHWTFALLIGWLLFITLQAGGTLPDAIREVVFICAVFLCVVLHEYGHALMARRYGVRTRDITILPIGGVARLERMPEKPSQELAVAIAGPLVNVALAVVILLGLLAFDAFPRAPADPTPAERARLAQDMGFFPRLLAVNVILVLFNMLPAFPMDGGRVLRALLAMKFDYGRATRIAAGVGQVMAALFVIGGIFTGNLWLVLIAVFVFMGAQAEAHEAQARGAFSGMRVGDAMVTDFRALDENATLADAVEALLSGSQPDFPVVAAGALVGVLPRDDLLRAIASRDRNTPVREVMRRDCINVSESETLDRVLPRVREAGCPMAPVLRDGRLTGLLTLDNLAELMMIRQAARQQRRPLPRPVPG